MILVPMAIFWPFLYNFPSYLVILPLDTYDCVLHFSLFCLYIIKFMFLLILKCQFPVEHNILWLAQLSPPNLMLYIDIFFIIGFIFVP